ncbi:MAG: heparinase II/III family protein [Thermoprotei archaeon]|nr:heparinase II/III family protein [Thermoprotei archaeon]
MHEHPYLLFSREEIPRLKRKIELMLGDLSEFTEKVRSGIARLREAKLTGVKEARFSSRIALRSAFAYALTGDEEFAAFTMDLVKAIMKAESWVMPPHRPLKVDLGVAGVAGVLGLIYDWLWDYMDDNTKEEVRETLIKRALEPFRNISSNKLEWWSIATHNWRSVICGNMGLAALSICDGYDKFKECIKEAIEGVIAVFDRIGTDGGYDEGVGYWSYGIGEGVKFVEALKRVSQGEANLYDHPKLKITGHFALYLYTPDGKCFNFSDCGYRPPSGWLIAKLASEYRDPYLQWLAWKLRSEDPYYLIFYDESLKYKEPDLPPHKLFKDIGVVVSRSDWGNEASFLGFKAGTTFAPHSHLDINSFVFYAYGKRLIKDLGSWPYTPDKGLGFFDVRERRWCYEANSTLGHNTLLVDGMGQTYGPKSYGSIIKAEFTDVIDVLISDGRRAYADMLKKFNRWLIFIKPRTLILVDEVESDRPRKFELLFHPDGELHENERGLEVVNEPAVLKISFLRPGPDEPRVISYRSSKSSYESRRGPTTQENAYVSISPLLKTKRYVFVTILHAYKAGTIPKVETSITEETPEELAIRIEVKDKRIEARIGLKKLAYSFKGL